MTKQEAISELTRAAEICPTTPLAEACRMAVEALRGDGEKPDCVNCRHADSMPDIYPCSQCEQRYSGVPSKWEPKEGGVNDIQKATENSEHSFCE